MIKYFGMNNDKKNEYLNFAKEVAYKAGDIMLKYFDDNVEKRLKDGDELVTIADEEINQMVIDEVRRVYPKLSVLGEEASSDNGSDEVWVCDPIDGTIPFTQGIPVSVFSLALVENGESIVGVVFDPFTKRLYSGAKDLGVFVNDQQIKVSERKLSGKQATVDVEWWPQADFDIGEVSYGVAMKTGAYLPCLGSTVNACCLVASGQYEACLFAGSKGKFVDIAAVKVIVEEAGGKVTDLFGNDQRYDKDIKGAIVSNGVVHNELLKFIGSGLEI